MINGCQEFLTNTIRLSGLKFLHICLTWNFLSDAVILILLLRLIQSIFPHRHRHRNRNRNRNRVPRYYGSYGSYGSLIHLPPAFKIGRIRLIQWHSPLTQTATDGHGRDTHNSSIFYTLHTTLYTRYFPKSFIRLPIPYIDSEPISGYISFKAK